MEANRTILGHKLNAGVAFKGPHRRPLYMPADPNQQIDPIIDLTKYDNLILDQGQEGDCTAAASGGAWMYLQILKWRLANVGYTEDQLQSFILNQTQCSMDFIYALELMYDGDFGADNGSFGASAAFVLETYGVCGDDVWANDGLGYVQKPSVLAMNAAAQNKVKTYQVLDLKQVRLNHSEGYPCFFGIPVFNSFVRSLEVMGTGKIPMPLSGEQPAGGHELKTIGHDDTRRVIILDNSWGTDVGVDGRFELPYDYWEMYASDAHTARLQG